MKQTEARIQKLIFEEYGKRALVVPNLYFRNSRFESDVVVIMKSGLSYEFEIKCSKADFRNEAKSFNKIQKHRYTGLAAERYRTNYFYYICPEDLIRPDELLIPDYGLAYVNGFRMRMVKKAKKLHDNRVGSDEYYGLARKMMYKLFNHSNRWKIRKAQ
jgi:hypothetical protein